MRQLLLILLTLNILQASYIIFDFASPEATISQDKKLTSVGQSRPLLLSGNKQDEHARLLLSNPLCDIDIKQISNIDGVPSALLNINGNIVEVSKGQAINKNVSVNSISSYGVFLRYGEFEQFLEFNKPLNPHNTDSEPQAMENVAFPYAESVTGLKPEQITDAYKNDINVISENELIVRRGVLSEFLASNNDIKSVGFAISSKGGFQATRVEQDGLFSNLGLETGDIIKSINNKELATISDVMGVYQQMDEYNSIELRLERQGQKVYYFYNFRD